MPLLVDMLTKVDLLYEFGPLRLIPARRALLAGERPIAIHSRAFDLLAVLVEQRDRVVSRDELLARVWAGTTVSDNNIGVQVAALRRVLAAHGANPKAIVNIPGRGYQFVGAVSERVVEPLVTSEPPSSTVVTSGAKRAGGRGALAGWSRWPIIVTTTALLAIVVVAAASHLQPKGSDNVEDYRLTIGIARFVGVGPNAASLADDYYDAIRTPMHRYDDIKIYPIKDPANASPYHFLLFGRLRVLGNTATLTYQLERPDGLAPDGASLAVSTNPSRGSLDEASHEVWEKVTSRMFADEAARMSGGPQDATYFYIKAQVEAPRFSPPDQLEAGIADLEHARRLDQNFWPAGVLLATLLTDHLPLTPSQAGDKEARQALRLTDELLRKRRDSTVAMELKAMALIELGNAKEAQRVALQALVGASSDLLLISTLLDAYTEDGDFEAADTILKDPRFGSNHDQRAQLAFARGQDALANDELDKYLPTESNVLMRSLMRLLKAASLAEIGNASDASKQVAIAMADLPREFQTQAALRRTFYTLPDDAWKRFKEGLTQARMPA